MYFTLADLTTFLSISSIIIERHKNKGRLYHQNLASLRIKSLLSSISKMTIFSTPKAPGTAVAKKQQMDYSSLTSSSPLPSISKSLFHCLSGIDEEDSSSESGSPRILIDSDDMGEKQVKGMRKHLKSPTSRSQRRTTDSFLPVCSLQALSRSSKKILPRMSFSSPNIMRGKSNKRPQSEKAKKIRSNNLTNVKLDMLNMLVETKNEEVANLKSLLHQSEQNVSMLESKLISLEEELRQQQLDTPSILEMSFGSNSEYNTDHDSQTIPYVSDEMLEDLTNQLQQKNGEIDVLEDEIEQWQVQADEWKNKYQALVEQMQNSTVSDDESTDTNDLITFCNNYEDDNLEKSGAGRDVESSIENDDERDNLTLEVKEIDGMTYIDTNNISSSSEGSQSPLHRGPTESDDTVNNENVQVGSVASRHLRNRAPLGESSLQNVETTPISNTKLRRRRRQKTSRYTPASNTNRTKEVKENDAPEENVEFGEVGYKFKKNFGWYGTYKGQVQEILPDGTRLCVYPADPNGDEYLTLEELGETKPLKLRRDKGKSKGISNPTNLDGGSDDTTDGVLQVKKNVTCHIW